MLKENHSKLQVRHTNLKKKRKADLDTERRAKKREGGLVEGCHQVTIAQQVVEVTGLERALLVADPGSVAAGQGEGVAARKRPRRVQNEVARDKLIVESIGGKAIRTSASGKKIGGLRWKDHEMASAVANWSLLSLSFRAAGKTTNAGMRTKGVRYWFKAQPLRKYKTRRVARGGLGSKTAAPEIPLVDISKTSMRDGVFAMELAKNFNIHERLRNAHAVALCSDYTTVGDKSVQGTHLRWFDIEDGGTDDNGTIWLIMVATSLVLDVWPTGDKILEETTYDDDSGVQRKLPVEAPRALAAQLIYAGIFWILLMCRCLSMTFDGGGEGTGLGNRERARETMAGENSYLDLVWLKRSAADSAFEMLNQARVFVPLMDFYGYDWENNEYMTRRQGFQSPLAPVREEIVIDMENSDPDSDAAGPAVLPQARISALRPIFDPLAGPADIAQPPMSIFDFVAWDMARAYSFLNLASLIRCITEEMVVRTETYMECLLDATLKNVLSDEEFIKVCPVECLKRLKPGIFASSDASFLVMEAMTRAMGGRLLMGNGAYSEEPPSPLIRVVASDAGKIHVLDSLGAELMSNKYKEGKTTSYFKNRRRLLAGCKAVDLTPGDTVFVGVHRPGHFVSMVAENLGSSDGTVARMTIADSLASPGFTCPLHDVLRVAFRESKLIGKEHEVDHFGRTLPLQDRVDCAFYMLTDLATLLSGMLLLPILWGYFTRLMRCWTFFLFFRDLLHRKAVDEVAVSEALRAWRNIMVAPRSPAAEKTVVSNRYSVVPLVISDTADKDALWMEAAEKAAEQARRQLLHQKAQERSEELGERAGKAWKKMERARPSKIDTSLSVPACRIPPMCARAGGKSEENWRNLYDPKREGPPLLLSMQKYRDYWPKVSMRKSPARYFAMVDQSDHPVPVAGWCGRHRFQAFSQACCVSEDQYPEMAEGCITCVRNACLWPRLKAHILTYVADKGGLTADPIHLGVRKCMRLRKDRCGPPDGARMVIKGDSDAPTVLEELTGRIKKGIFLKPQVSAPTRWGTRFEGQWQLGVNGRVFGAGVIQLAGDGTTKALQKCAAAPFQQNGFEVDGCLRMPSAKLGKHLRCLVSQKFNFYHAVNRFLCVLVVRPILLAYSTHLECPAAAVCGVSSYFRRFLHFVTDEMFVGLFNSADGNSTYRNAQALGRSDLYRGTSHKFDAETRKLKSDARPHGIVKLAHRGWASLRGTHKTLFLIKPSANVQGVLGEFTTPEMVGCVRALLCDLRRTAEMAGNLQFLPTLENRWKGRETSRTGPSVGSNWSAVIAAGKDKPVVDSGASVAERRKTASAVAGAQYAHNMHKAQWAVREIMQDVVKATEKWFDNELYSLFGFLACMIRTRWVKVREKATGKTKHILTAHEDSRANGQVASRILDEMGEQFHNQGDHQFLDYYPPQLTDLLKDEVAMREFAEFLSGDAMPGFDDCYLLDAEGNVALEDAREMDENGQPKKIPVVPRPVKPLWLFPSLARRVLVLFFRQMTSNDVERVFSLVARGFRGGGKNVGFRCISSWCRRRDWVSGRFFGMEVNTDFLKVYSKARSLVCDNEQGFQKVFTADLDSSEMRKRWRQQKHLPLYMKRGTRTFVQTNIVPYKNESAVGPKKTNSDTDPTLPEIRGIPNRANSRKGHQMFAHLTALKRRQPRRPSAKATIAVNRKRKRDAQALQSLHGYPRSSKRAHSGSADAAEEISGGDEPKSERAEESPSELRNGGRMKLAAAAEGGDAASTAEDSDENPPELDQTLAMRRVMRRNIDSDIRGGAVRRKVITASESRGSDPGETSATANPQAQAGKARAVCRAGQAAAAGAAGTAGKHSASSGVRKHAPNSHPLVQKMQEKIDDELSKEGAVWTPSVRVEHKAGHQGERHVFGMKRPDGEVIVVRNKESSSSLNLAYDHAGDGCVKLIKIMRTETGKANLFMEYYFVYPTEKAIQEAAREEDHSIEIEDKDGNKPTYRQLGRKTIRSKAEHWNGVALHHVGDIIHKSSEGGSMNLGNIVGIVAWTTCETLDTPNTTLTKHAQSALSQSLSALGIKKAQATYLAADPIFIACAFGERKPARIKRSSAIDDSDDDDVEKEENDSSGDCGVTGVQVKKASSEEARKQREKAVGKQRAKADGEVHGDDGGDQNDEV